jgi:hypothetical protein
MGWIAAVGQLFRAVGAYFGFATKQQERDNAPDIVANKTAQTSQQEQEKIQKDVEEGDKTGNLDKERQDWG